MTEWTTKGKLPTKADELRSLIKDAQRKGFNWRPANADVLAALDAAEAQGYARAMGEVDSLLQQRVQAHRDVMLDRMPQYAHDIRQGAREEATEIREWLQRRLPAAAERD